MNVLWITNILFPEVLERVSSEHELKSSGGWMVGAAHALVDSPDVKLFVASVSNLVTRLTIFQGEKIAYYVLPYGKGNLKENPEYKKYWTQINSEVHPDVVHIYGTEFSHGLSYMQLFGVQNVVISIQGLLSIISKYYCAGITNREILNNMTFRDLVRGTILRDKKNFLKRSKYEIRMLEIAKHVIGRTSWDRANVLELNPKLTYHFCNETLRQDFYTDQIWKYERCTKHTIFISQMAYPLKGFHQLLKAMPIILKEFPDTVIRVAGYNPIKYSSLRDKLRLSGYGRYLRSLIRRYNLSNHVCILGSLSSADIKQELLKANVFVCPSSIENSPNSLAEAQILGVPCVASYVGGIPDMMHGNEENMYRFEETAMLADKVCKVFSNGDKQKDMRSFALERHDCEQNCAVLLNIYKNIIEVC